MTKGRIIDLILEHAATLPPGYTLGPCCTSESDDVSITIVGPTGGVGETPYGALRFCACRKCGEGRDWKSYIARIVGRGIADLAEVAAPAPAPLPDKLSILARLRARSGR